MEEGEPGHLVELGTPCSSDVLLWMCYLDVALDESNHTFLIHLADTFLQSNVQIVHVGGTG